MANYSFDLHLTENLALPLLTDCPQDTNALIQKMQAGIRYTQDQQEINANVRRVPDSLYKVGDEVWLNARNIQTTRPSWKLDWKYLSRFKFKSVISPYAYKLDLPPTMNRHPVSNVLKLEPCTTDLLPRHISLLASPVIVKGDEDWEVDEPLDSHPRYSCLQYLVKWKGHDAPTWEYTENLTNIISKTSFVS